MRATWRMLAGRRDLRLVLSAGIISMTGDWILTIGLIYTVYATTGSTVAIDAGQDCGLPSPCRSVPHASRLLLLKRSSCWTC